MALSQGQNLALTVLRCAIVARQQSSLDCPHGPAPDCLLGGVSLCLSRVDCQTILKSAHYSQVANLYLAHKKQRPPKTIQ